LHSDHERDVAPASHRPGGSGPYRVASHSPLKRRTTRDMLRVWSSTSSAVPSTRAKRSSSRGLAASGPCCRRSPGTPFGIWAVAAMEARSRSSPTSCTRLPPSRRSRAEAV